MVSGAAQQGKASSLFFYAGRVVTQKTLIGTLPLEPDAMLALSVVHTYRNKRKEAGHKM